MRPIKTTLKLISKKKLTETVFLLTFKSSENIDFEPGQYANLEVEEGEWRSYSVADFDEKTKEISFLVDTAPGGLASKIFQEIEPEVEMRSILPSGFFTLRDSDRPKIFVCTGTGLAPFFSMIDKLYEQGFDKEIYVLFGVRYLAKDFATPLLKDYLNKDNFKLVRCVTRPEKEGDYKEGRVTKVLFEMGLKLEAYDIYVCGAPQMTGDVVKFLKENGITENVYYELY